MRDRMRETIQQVAKKLLEEPAGTERVVEINVNDGLTGVPPGMSPRGLRFKSTTLRVDTATRADGKKRKVVTAPPKPAALAAGDWE